MVNPLRPLYSAPRESSPIRRSCAGLENPYSRRAYTAYNDMYPSHCSQVTFEDSHSFPHSTCGEHFPSRHLEPPYEDLYLSRRSRLACKDFSLPRSYSYRDHGNHPPSNPSRAHEIMRK